MQHRHCIFCIVMFLMCFTVKTSYANDAKTISKTPYEEQVLAQYINFFENLKEQIKKHKDVLDIVIYGSRAPINHHIGSTPQPNVTIGYGNDAYSDLDTLMIVKQYDKYCNCNWVKNYFNIDLCYVKTYHPHKCSVKFMKNDIIVSIAIYQQNIEQKKIWSYDINKFFILAIEVQQLLTRTNLEPRKQHDIESKLYQMLYILEKMQDKYENKYYDIKLNIIKHKKHQESLDKIINDMLEIKSPLILPQDSIGTLDETTFALKYLEKIKHHNLNK